MSTTVEIEFFNSQDLSVEPLRLKWNVLNGDAATVWLRCLIQSLKKDQLYYARFNGFKNTPKDLRYLSNKMNEAIEIINLEGFYPEIKERADGIFSQEFANIMHHHFEVLFGDAKDPSEYFRKSSFIGKAAISVLNHCVHDMEALHRSTEINDSSRAVVFEILDRQQFLLPHSLDSQFTFDLNFGDICLHYGLVGKTWWEVFLDKDEEIFPEAIRPLDVLGPEFDIHFHTNNPDPQTLEKFKSFLKENGQNPDDPCLRLGFLPVARLNLESGKNESEIIESVGLRSGVSSIKVLQEGRIVIEKDFRKSLPCHEGFLKLHSLQMMATGESVETQGFPNEGFVLTGEREGTRLGEVLTKGGIIEAGHALAFYVPKDGNSVIIPASEEKRGFLWKEDYVIKPGEHLCVLYDGHTWYSPVIEEKTSPDKGDSR